MNSFVDGLNAVCAWAVDAALWPVSGWSDNWQLIWVSALSGVLFLLAYGAVSNQSKLRSVKRQISAALLEVVLFRHDLRSLFKAQGRLFAYAAAYFLIAVPPILFLLIPCLLLLAQLNLHFAYRGLLPGEQTIVKAKIEDRRLLYRVNLEAPASMEVTPPLRIPETQEIVWRVRAKEPAADSQLNLKLGENGKAFTPRLALGQHSAPIVTHYYRDWWWKILYPDTALEAVDNVLSFFSMSYPEQEHRLFGAEMHWVIIFAIVSIATGLIASRVLGVEV